jgi:hypothetical protein
MTRTHGLPARRVAVATAALLLAAYVAVPTPATAHGADPTLGGGLWDPNQALRFSWRTGAEPPAAIKSAIRSAATDATATRASKAASIAYDAAGPNLIGYGSGATCGVNGLACFSRSAPDGFSMWFREQGHVYDWGTLKWCQSYTTAPNGCYDAETIALDEFGHVEGLDHHINYADDHDYEDAVVQTFSRTKPAAGWNTHGFGPCDTTTLQRLYDLPTWSAKVSSCQNLTTTVTLSASPALVAYGGSTTLTAVLRLAESDAYGQLSLDPLAGRTVSLQRRATGTTAWIAAGTMSAGPSSGTYVASPGLVSVSEFRVVFAAPADEGLKGATSAVVRVVVGRCASATCPLVPPAAADPAG